MNNVDTLVAIHCLAYNHEPYIRDCLDGFVMQKTSFRFVAIVHDDASTDKTAVIIREYEAKYPDIIKPIYETENQYSKHDGSLDRIMNSAIDATGAKYVAMCEGDDYWIDPMKLQEQVEFLEQHDDYVMVGTECVIRNNNSIHEENYPLELPYKQIGKWKTYGRVLSTAVYGPITRTCSLMYRNIIPIDIRSLCFGDLILQAVLSSFGCFAKLDRQSCVYRVHGGGISNSKSFASKLSFARFIKEEKLLIIKLFPDICHFSEDEIEDAVTYVKLKNAICCNDFKQSIHIKSQIKSKIYKKKKYYRYLRGHISHYILGLVVRRDVND